MALDENFLNDPENRDKITAYLLKKRDEILSKIPSLEDFKEVCEDYADDYYSHSFYSSDMEAEMASELFTPYSAVHCTLNKLLFTSFSRKEVADLKEIKNNLNDVQHLDILSWDIRSELTAVIEELNDVMTYCYFADRQGKYIISDDEILFQNKLLDFDYMGEEELKRIVAPEIKGRVKEIERKGEVLDHFSSKLPIRVVVNLSEFMEKKEVLEKDREYLFRKYNEVKDNSEINPELLDAIERDLAYTEARIKKCEDEIGIPNMDEIDGPTRELGQIMKDFGLIDVATVDKNILKKLQNFVREEYACVEHERKILSQSLISLYKKNKPSNIADDYKISSDSSKHWDEPFFLATMRNAQCLLEDILNPELKAERQRERELDKQRRINVIDEFVNELEGTLENSQIDEFQKSVLRDENFLSASSPRKRIKELFEEKFELKTERSFLGFGQTKMYFVNR